MEDRKVIISGHLITAALQMLAILSAVTVFIMDKRDVGFVYYICIGLSFLSFILSIYYGAKGIGSNYEISKSLFNKQAIFSFLGLIIFSISVYIGIKIYNPTKNLDFIKENRLTNKFDAYNSDLKKAQENILRLTKKVFLLDEELDQLKRKNSNKMK
jgi:hypothetical protein